MLTDLSPAHLLLFAVFALLVIGPKDLPAALRKAGQFMARIRGMANEFRTSFDDMARQSELDELRKEVEAMRVMAGKPVSDMNDYMQPLIDLQPDPTPLPVVEPVVEPAILPPVEPKPASEPKAAKAKSGGGKNAPKTAAKSQTSKAKASKRKTAPPSGAGA